MVRGGAGWCGVIVYHDCGLLAIKCGDWACCGRGDGATQDRSSCLRHNKTVLGGPIPPAFAGLGGEGEEGV